jgi:uncharacterized protein YodC (DUF2158 family)
MYPLTNRCMIVATLLPTVCAPYSALASPTPVSSHASVASNLAPRLKRGDLVRSVSGGPAMTVSDVKGEQINCSWTDFNGQPDNASSPAYVLQKL